MVGITYNYKQVVAAGMAPLDQVQPHSSCP